MEPVCSPSPAGWSCAAQAQPGDPGAGGRAAAPPAAFGDTGGTRPLPPRLPAQHPSPPGSREAIIEKIVGREGSPGAPRSCVHFSICHHFSTRLPTFPLFPHPHPFPLHSFPVSPLTLLFYPPFPFLSPSHASPSYFFPSLHPVFSHVVGKTSPPSTLPVPNSSSSLPLQPQAVLHLLSPFLIPSPPSGHLLCC